MSWDLEGIKKSLRERIVNRFKDKTKEELIERILELETAVYPFAVVLGSLNEESWRGTTASSKLFPLLSEEGEKFQVYVPSDEPGKVGGSEKLLDGIKEEELHEVGYYLEDSINIVDGSKLHDSFTILDVHQQAPGAYVGCGSITMGDVRHLMKIRTKRST